MMMPHQTLVLRVYIILMVPEAYSQMCGQFIQWSLMLLSTYRTIPVVLAVYTVELDLSL